MCPMHPSGSREHARAVGRIGVGPAPERRRVVAVHVAGDARAVCEDSGSLDCGCGV